MMSHRGGWLVPLTECRSLATVSSLLFSRWFYVRVRSFVPDAFLEIMEPGNLVITCF